MGHCTTYVTRNRRRDACTTGLAAILALALVALAGCKDDGLQDRPGGSPPTANSLPQSAPQSMGGPLPGHLPDPFPGRGRMPFLPVPPLPEVIEPTFAAPGGEFKAPVRIHETERGWLLVTDTQRKAVLRVNPATMKPDQSLPFHDTPLSVAMLGAEIFVGLKDAKAIEVRTYRGAPKGFLAAPGSIGYPSDLATDPAAGLLFALDGIARTVRVYRAADRSLVGTLGGGQLAAPSGLTTDPGRQEVLVSDYGSGTASVQVFSYAAQSFGSLVGTISGAGTCSWFGCNGGFSRPRGPAAGNGQVYVPDAIQGQVLVYARDTGVQVARLGNPDPVLRDLQLPSDALIGAQGDLLVTSTLTRSVVVFRGVAP